MTQYLSLCRAVGDIARSIRRYFETEQDALEFLLEIEDTVLH
jgi:hypothetical protein